MKVRPRVQSQQEERCAVCRDGPEGLVVCRGCGTFLHASCLIDVRGCPTIGCNEKDPLQEEAKPQFPPGTRPGPYGVEYDPVKVWNYDVSQSPYSVKEMTEGSVVTQVVGNNNVVSIGGRAGLENKDHEAIRRAEEGPQKEPGCNHQFHPLDDKCVYCRTSVMDEASREAHIGALNYSREKVVCAARCCEEPTIRAQPFCSLCRADEEIYGDLACATEKHGAEAVMDSFMVTCGEQRSAIQIHWGVKDYTFWAVVILPPLLTGLYQLIWG